MFWQKQKQQEHLFEGVVKRIGFVTPYVKVQGYFAVVLEIPGQGLRIVRLVATLIEHYEKLTLTKPGDKLRVVASLVTFHGTIGEVHAGPKHKVIHCTNETLEAEAEDPRGG